MRRGRDEGESGVENASGKGGKAGLLSYHGNHFHYHLFIILNSLDLICKIAYDFVVQECASCQLISTRGYLQ